MKKIPLPLFIILGSAVALGTLTASDFTEKNLIEADTTLSGEILPYVGAEYQETSLPSRRWVAYLTETLKPKGLSLPRVARYFAYITSLYSSVLEETDSKNDASLATAKLLDYFFPEKGNETRSLVASLDIRNTALSPKGELLLQEFIERSRTDRSEMVWDGKIPVPDRWFIRNNRIDESAAAKEWQTWVIDLNKISAPPPPTKSGFRDDREIEKVVHAMNRRTPDDEEVIFFWNGVETFAYGKQSENLSLAGIWQNILFAEMGKTKDDKTFARAQKILAQIIADTSITVWKNKYTHFRELPSMRIPGLTIIGKDPPYPSYVSEHSAIGTAAAAALSTLFPEKKDIWLREERNSSNSRLLAGASFPSDIQEGKNLGRLVAKEFFPDSPLNLSVNRPSSFYNLSLIKDSAVFFVQKSLQTVKNGLLGALKIRDGTFIEVASESGLAEKYETGAAWADFDGDGYLDLLTAQGLYRNTRDGKFVKVIGPKSMGGAGFFGDYNNDGCPDIYTVRSGPPKPTNPEQLVDKLWKNNCDGTFTDLTEAAGIHDTYHGIGAAWADYNSDGFLDLYVGNRGVVGDDVLDVKPDYLFEPNILYRNNGDETFTDVTVKAGVDGILDCDFYRKDAWAYSQKLKLPFQPIWFDYNNDNKIDLFVSTDAYLSPLYRNNGDGTFTQVTEEAGLCKPGHASNMGVTVGDYNNDGWLDLYVTNSSHNFLWRNNGDGTFAEVAKETGADEVGYGWGTEFLDYDNDGDLDLLVVNGNNRLPARRHYVPDLKRNDLDELLENNGDGTFTPAGQREGISNINEIKFSASVGDYNNDGFPDIFIPMAAERHLSSASVLYRNRGNDNHWLTVQLLGTKSNYDAVGARIKATVGGRVQMQEIVSGSSFVSQKSLWQTFGLGKAKKVDTLEIRWPSGLVQTFENLAGDRKIIIKEGDDTVHTSLAVK